MNEAIQPLLGQLVKITSLGPQTHFVDTGILEVYDYPWVRLRKSTGETLCFPVYNIRLIEQA